MNDEGKETVPDEGIKGVKETKWRVSSVDFQSDNRMPGGRITIELWTNNTEEFKAMHKNAEGAFDECHKILKIESDTYGITTRLIESITGIMKGEE